MRFFCLWIPHFAAWAIAQTQPQLNERAFAVCEGGKVVAPSPLAEAVGIAPGMSSGAANSKLSSLLITARDRNCENLAWAEIQRSFYGLTPKVESVEPGLLFAEVMQEKALPFLRAWGAHGGEAADRATAHLAALTINAGHSRQIRSKRERDFTEITPIAHLKKTGISKQTIERLEWFGWSRVGQLTALTRRQLEEQVGVDGLLLYRFAQGPQFAHNLRPIAQWRPPEEISESLEFEAAATQPAHWNLALNDLLQRCCDRLGTRQTQTIEITAQTPTAPVTARRILKEPLSQPRAMRAPADAALNEALGILYPLPPVVLRLEVRLGGLTNAPFQQTLFEDEKATRSKRLKSALQHLENRMPGQVGHYVSQQPYSPFPEARYGWLSALEASVQSSTRAHGSCRSHANPLGLPAFGGFGR